MRPDIAGLGVDSKHRLETGVHGGQRRTVSLEQKVVVAQPVGERVVRQRSPARHPDVLGELLHALGAVLGHVKHVAVGQLQQAVCFIRIDYLEKPRKINLII